MYTFGMSSIPGVRFFTTYDSEFETSINTEYQTSPLTSVNTSHTTVYPTWYFSSWYTSKDTTKITDWVSQVYTQHETYVDPSNRPQYGRKWTTHLTWKAFNRFTTYGTPQYTSTSWVVNTSHVTQYSSEYNSDHVYTVETIFITDIETSRLTE